MTEQNQPDKKKRKSMSEEAKFSFSKCDDALYYDTSTKTLEYLCVHFHAPFIFENLKFENAEQFFYFKKFEIYGKVAAGEDQEITLQLEEFKKKILQTEGLKCKDFEHFSTFYRSVNLNKKKARDFYDRIIKLSDDFEEYLLYTANYLKFSQNPDLTKKLIETGDKPLRLKRGRFAIPLEEFPGFNVKIWSWFMDKNKLAYNGIHGDSLVKVRNELIKVNRQMELDLKVEKWLQGIEELVKITDKVN